jgi:hypothetical protein
MRKLHLAIVLLLLSVLACNVPRTGPLPDGEGPSPAPGESPQASPTLGTPADTPTPSDTPRPTDTLPPTASPTPRTGAVQGGIYGYPYGSIPKLVFVAFNQQNSSYWYWIIAAGQSYYETDLFISPGKYQVVAYDGSGHRGGCTTIVTVISDQTVQCDITDWGGSYPAKPAGVPSP